MSRDPFHAVEDHVDPFRALDAHLAAQMAAHPEASKAPPGKIKAIVREELEAQVRALVRAYIEEHRAEFLRSVGGVVGRILRSRGGWESMERMITREGHQVVDGIIREWFGAKLAVFFRAVMARVSLEFDQDNDPPVELAGDARSGSR